MERRIVWLAVALLFFYVVSMEGHYSIQLVESTQTEEQVIR